MNAYRIADREYGLQKQIYNTLAEARDALADWVVKHSIAYGGSDASMAEAKNTYRIVVAATGEEVSA
jgi:hypothetical protein